MNNHKVPFIRKGKRMFRTPPGKKSTMTIRENHPPNHAGRTPRPREYKTSGKRTLRVFPTIIEQVSRIILKIVRYFIAGLKDHDLSVTKNVQCKVAGG